MPPADNVMGNDPSGRYTGSLHNDDDGGGHAEAICHWCGTHFTMRWGPGGLQAAAVQFLTERMEHEQDCTHP